MLKIMGILLIVVALVVAIVPNFTDCYSQGKQIELPNGKLLPMKCHWTAKAEIGAGILLFATGLTLIFIRRKETAIVLSILGILIGAVIIVLPAGLIGVCTTPTMICATVMKPILMIGGALAIIASLVALITAARMKE